MEITYRAVLRLAQDNGTIDVIDAQGIKRSILDDEDGPGLVDQADTFRFKGIWYSRREFENILDKYLKIK
jgi:hypothetical protein